VEALRDGNGFPGMKILQFAFCDGANFYRPHTYGRNCVVYTGTHDNDTTRGWYAAWGDDYAHMGRDVIDRERDFARRYLAVDGNNIHWDMIRLAIASPADTAIYPMQDILGLGNDCRFNRPGVPTGNWTWRLTWEQLDHAEVNYLRDMTEIFDRAGNYR
ncbi:MAG: 4-alpha-glucanotransferase, partial [Planctomycetes bacterium]|nr:4-alpha-glucanotransferase [Planctomycetota bacterium]